VRRTSMTKHQRFENQDLEGAVFQDCAP